MFVRRPSGLRRRESLERPPHYSTALTRVHAGAIAATFVNSVAAERVIAVENDPRCAEILRKKAQTYANIAVLERNILQLKWPKRPFCVVASIPCAITTPIMVKLLDAPSDNFRVAVMLIEYGAAKRFTARIIRDPRILGWRMVFDLEFIETVPRNQFSPPPRVDSAIFRVRRKATPLVATCHRRTFAGLAEYALKHPDLPLGIALKGIFTAPQIAYLCRNLGVDSYVPVCKLTEEQWGRLFRTMMERVPPYRWPTPKR